MKKFIVSAMMVLALVGCTTAPVLNPPTVPANINKRCPDLPHIEPGANMGSQVKAYIELQHQYATCAARSDSQIEINNQTQGK